MCVLVFGVHESMSPQEEGCKWVQRGWVQREWDEGGKWVERGWTEGGQRMDSEQDHKGILEGITAEIDHAASASSVTIIG